MDPIIWAALITAVANIIATLIKTNRRPGRSSKRWTSSRSSASDPRREDAPPGSARDRGSGSRPETDLEAADWIRPRARRASVVYVALVSLLALGALAWLYRDSVPIDWSKGLAAIVEPWTEPIEWHPNPLRLLLFWFSLTLGFSLFTGALPKGGATTTVASVPDLAALLMFGPATASVLVGLTDLVSNVADRRKGALKIVFNFFQITLTVAVTGIVYELCGGRFGEDIRLDGLGALVPFVVAPLVYFTTNTSLVAIAIRLVERVSVVQVWRRNYQWQLPHVFLMLLPFGTLLAVCQLHFAAPGALLCSLTVILAHFSYQGWLQNRSARFESARMIVSEIDRSDASTANHSNRIAAYAVRIAWDMGLSRQETDDIEFAALFHNLGTIAMKHVFLTKPTDLTEAETLEMRRHPEIAYRLLRKVPLLHGAAEILHCHQERPDGRGYPNRLTDSEIPLGSKILLAVDAFDAMVHGRAHKRRWAPAEAYEELRRNVPHQFSSTVVETLIRLHAQGRLDEELDASFRGEQARQRYGFQVVRYRFRQNVRRAVFFLRKALLALFGGNGTGEFHEPGRPPDDSGSPAPEKVPPAGPASAKRETRAPERPTSEWHNGS